jgi:hypothetical protein|nr:MAG TPA: homing endonuclease [Caudoviricetes sp.]
MSYICDPADFAGNFIEEVEPIRSANGRKFRQVKLKCLNVKCSKEFVTELHNAKRTKQMYCCKSCYQQTNFHFGIPNEKHPLYKRWLSMTQRCTTPSHNMYHNYGGRGITIEPYLRDFIQYAEYVLSLPNCPSVFPTKMEIDRIDNNGNYERGNLRWVTKAQNSANARRKCFKHKSGFVGVNWSVRYNKYIVRIRHNGKYVFLGWFDDPLEGAKVREQYIKDNNLTNILNNV